MFVEDTPAPDRYVLISALLVLHEEAPALDEFGIGDRAVELAETITDSRSAYLHVVEQDGDIRLACWSARTLAQCAIQSETHSPLNRHLAVPVLEKGVPVLVLGVGNKRTPYTDDDIDRVRLLAESAWGLLRRKAHRQREARHLEFLEANMVATIDVVSTIVAMRDPYTAGHERRVTHLARAIAGELGLDEETQDRVAMAARVHDVGKLAVPPEVLAKPGRLTPMEMEVARSHSRQGYEILRKSNFSWPLAEVVLQHHERYDGSGYPEGLRGEQIMLEARVIAVADVVEAISSNRPHRPGRPLETALAEIESGAGTRYDPDVARVCLALFRDKGYTLPGD